MNYICQDNIIYIRKLEDCLTDYNLLVKWLSDPAVLEYYEGRSNPFNLEKVMEKFGDRTRGKDYVIPCIIEYDKEAIGYVQYYRDDVESSWMDKYPVNKKIDRSKYHVPYAIDIIIGETDYWDKGLGTKIMCLLNKYLFENKQADIIFIAPQTWNKRAIRCYEKSGFMPITIIEKNELHDGEYKDSLIMALTKNDWTV